jgi:hypothetical protein
MKTKGKHAMRRALVLTDESARHPFRSTLPAHLRRAPVAVRRTTDWRLTASDLRGFATVYFASFAAVLAFIV